MRERFPGFYRPTEEEFKELWQTALIVPDTNVLLTLYRVSEATRAKLLQIFKGFGERLFVPHQVGFEFQKRRIGVIDEQKRAYEKVESQIKGLARKAAGNMGRHPRLDKSDLEERISKALEPIQAHVAETREKHPDPMVGDDALGADTVRDELDQILVGRLGEPRDPEELTKVGRRRYERDQPPGFEDREKDEPERYGDLEIWLDMIDKAGQEKKGVIFVTEERKADWWWKRDNEILAPRFELVEEMRREAAGQQFYMYGLEQFMDRAAEELEITLSPDERSDAARAGDAAAAESSQSDWWNVTLSQPVVGSGAQYVFPPLGSGEVFRTQKWPKSRSWIPSFLQQWNVEALEVGPEALLRVSWKSDSSVSGPETTYVCRVLTPAGELHEAVVRSSDMSASVVYPVGFPSAVKPEAGSHSFEWLSSNPHLVLPQPLGRGTFELDAPGEGSKDS
ncbi:MAG TPA: PIN-like domain-containing protein [Solirubrobacterales bacterium]|nr:PIN-like domain-containing protein [Solirubrobacterales bacterium]